LIDQQKLVKMQQVSESWQPSMDELRQVCQQCYSSLPDMVIYLRKYRSSPCYNIPSRLTIRPSNKFSRFGRHLYYFLLISNHVMQRLDQLNAHPEFCCYLLYILSKLTEEQV
jgi:hypothetical protein